MVVYSGLAFAFTSSMLALCIRKSHQCWALITCLIDWLRRFEGWRMALINCLFDWLNTFEGWRHSLNQAAEVPPWRLASCRYRGSIPPSPAPVEMFIGSHALNALTILTSITRLSHIVDWTPVEAQSIDYAPLSQLPTLRPNAASASWCPSIDLGDDEVLYSNYY